RTDRTLGFLAAQWLFSNRPEEIEFELRAWAVRKCLEAMWSPPAKSEAGAPATVSGWRQPMVIALTRLGSDMLPAVLEAAEKFKARYSGAMGAFATALEAIGDETAVPLVTAMIQCALTHQDDA